MDDNLIDIQNFVKKYKDSLVISHDRLYVLRGNTQDDMDYYWLLQDIKGKYSEHSCVGEVIPLKGFIENDSYKRTKGYFQINLDLISKEVV